MLSPHTGKIIEWNPASGFGFVNRGGEKLFLHIRDFRMRPRFLKTGDRVEFHEGRDEKGRPRATHARLLTWRSGLRLRDFLTLFPLLVLPALAVLLLPVNLWVAVAALTFISLVTWANYRSDKKRAQSGHWRIEEQTLHGLELIGGWPIAYLAQRNFRHKTAKPSFQRVFWLIVALHQFMAFDFLADWRFSRRLWATTEPLLSQLINNAGLF